jgi:hypothetical protein
MCWTLGLMKCLVVYYLRGSIVFFMVSILSYLRPQHQKETWSTVSIGRSFVGGTGVGRQAGAEHNQVGVSRSQGSALAEKN